jgi:nucleolar protein 9
MDVGIFHSNVFDHSIEVQPVEELLALAHHKTSSRVLDMVFESPTVTRKSKRALVMAFLGHYHQLVDDKFGSRVGDRCWDNADPYLKVRPLVMVL